MLFSRRDFLQTTFAGATLIGLNAGVLRQAAFANEPSDGHPILVVVHLRGACDGLNLVCPSNDPHLIAARPSELRVLSQGDKAGHELKNDATKGIDWRLHNAAAELAELYKDGSLGFVHAAGIPEANRSHFVATDIIDHGADKGASLSRIRGGWLGRYLAAAHVTSSPLAGISGSPMLAGEFAGFGALSIPDLNAGLPLPWDEKSADAIRLLYASTPGPAGDAGRRALHAADAVRGKLERGPDGKFLPYADFKEAYDKAGDIGRGLRTIARLIKLDMGLIAATVDVGGWDTHEGQPGRFQNNVQRLSTGLGAFWNDLAAYHNRLIVVAYGEFGRRLRANRSNGTDHGRGGAMLVLGGKVHGGRIVGPWPGLDDGVLEERVDLPVKTDYRQVLTELLEHHGGKALAPDVFPGYAPPAKLGLFKA